MTRLAHALLPFRFAPLLALPLGLVPRTAGAADPPADAAPEAATAASSIAALHFPATTRARLPNGLTIVLEENHQSPFVALQLRYAGGSCDEPAGKEGLAALTQRMMMMGTRHVPGGGYDATLDRIGATERGSSAGMESLIQSVTVPSNAVDSVLWLWSDQMGFFAPDDPKAQYNLAVLLNAAGRSREAIAHLEIAVKLKPDFDAARTALARLRLLEVAAGK